LVRRSRRDPAEVNTGSGRGHSATHIRPYERDAGEWGCRSHTP
jgi:hypothetical protein